MKKQKKSPDTAWALGHINWYDPDSGKGSIIGDDGVWYRIQEFSEIQSKKTKNLKVHTRVEFALALDSINPIIKCVREANKTKSEIKKVMKARPHQKARSI